MMYESQVRVQFVAVNDLDAHAFLRKLHKLLLLVPDVEFVIKGPPHELPYHEEFWQEVRGPQDKVDFDKLMREKNSPLS